MVDNRSTAAASTDQIIATDFKSHVNKTLLGFATLSLPAAGISLFECTYHRRADGKAWVGFPARSYVQNGEKKWKRLVDTTSKESHYRFQYAAVQAIEKYLAQHPPAQPPAQPSKPASAPRTAYNPQAVDDSDIPF